MLRVLILSLVGLTMSVAICAQNAEWRSVRKGNRAFAEKKFPAAAAAYRQAMTPSSRQMNAAYNLGNAYLSQQKTAEALAQYEKVIQSSSSPRLKALAAYNTARIHHAKKEWEKAIAHYKSALRLQPQDEDARYNLSLALKQQQAQSSSAQSKSSEKSPQQQNAPQKDSGKGKHKSQQNDATTRSQSHANAAQQDNERMSRENAEMLMQLSRQAEQTTQARLQRTGQPTRRQPTKNW